MEDYLVARLHNPETRDSLRMVLGWQLDRCEDDPEARASVEADLAALDNLDRVEAEAAEAAEAERAGAATHDEDGVLLDEHVDRAIALTNARQAVAARLAPRTGVAHTVARTTPLRREGQGSRVRQPHRRPVRISRTRGRERRPGRRTSSVSRTSRGDPTDSDGPGEPAPDQLDPDPEPQPAPAADSWAQIFEEIQAGGIQLTLFGRDVA